jgi:tetratricopeptide (TPR) repeat protein
MYPKARETRAVRGYLARMQWESDQTGAVASTDAVIAEAVADKDDEHYLGGLYLKMNFLRGQHKLDEARALAAEILSHDCGSVFRAEVELFAALTYLDEHDHEGALSRLDKVAGNDSYPDDVRAAALSTMGTIYVGQRRYDEAEAAFRQVTTQFPKTGEAQQCIGWEERLAQRRALLPAGQVFAN